jgi:hypothetical protein
MNTLAAFVRAGSVRFFHLHPGHTSKGRRGFLPHLEGLEHRVVPSGGGSHLSNTAVVSGPGNDQLDTFWGPTNAGTPPNSATQSSPGGNGGQITAFNSPHLTFFAPLAALPVVTVTNPDPFASEDPTFPPGTPETEDTAFFRIMRSSATSPLSGGGEAPLVDNSQPLTVFFTIGGTATDGVDYVFLQSAATIPAGQDFVDVTVIPFPRPPMVPVPLVSVTLTLEASANYAIGQQNEALVVIFEGARFPRGGSGGMPPPVNPPPTVTPTPNPFTTAQESISLGTGKNVRPAIAPPPASAQVPLAGLPLDPALRDRPGGLLPPARADEIALVGGTNAVGQISGRIFEDFNGTGTADGFKPGIAGVTVFLDLKKTGTLDHGDPTTTTNDNGEYAFTGLQAGTYIIRHAMPGNVLQTLPANEAPYEVVLERMSDAAVTERNFGLQLLSSRGRAVGTPGRRLQTVPAKPNRPPSPGGGGADGSDDEDGSD